MALAVGCGGGDDATGDGSSGCRRGSEGCFCGPALRCDDGSSCANGRCVRGQTVGIALNDANARACEVVLDDPKQALVSVGFDDSLFGNQQRRGAVVAMGFASQQDAPIDGAAVRISVIPGVATRDSGITLRSARCFDRLGKELSAARIDLKL